MSLYSSFFLQYELYCLFYLLCCFFVVLECFVFVCFFLSRWLYSLLFFARRKFFFFHFLFCIFSSFWNVLFCLFDLFLMSLYFYLFLQFELYCLVYLLCFFFLISECSDLSYFSYLDVFIVFHLSPMRVVLFDLFVALLFFVPTYSSFFAMCYFCSFSFIFHLRFQSNFPYRFWVAVRFFRGERQFYYRARVFHISVSW